MDPKLLEDAFASHPDIRAVIAVDVLGQCAEAVRLALEAEDIEARPVWKPMHLQPVFAGFPMIGGAVSKVIFEHGLCLPSGSSLSEDDRERVVGVVDKALT